MEGESDPATPTRYVAHVQAYRTLSAISGGVSYEAARSLPCVVAGRRRRTKGGLELASPVVLAGEAPEGRRRWIRLRRAGGESRAGGGGVVGGGCEVRGRGEGWVLVVVVGVRFFSG